MNALELVRYAPTRHGPPYVFIDACYTRACPAWRQGKKHGPCNCGADELLKKVKGYLAATEVLDIFADALSKGES